MIRVRGGPLGALDPNPDLAVGLELLIPPERQWQLVPSFGVGFSNDRWAFLHMDLRSELWLNESWLVTPRVGVGGLSPGTDGFDLGNTLEFRTGFELEHRFRNGWRLGMEIFHLSNAGISNSNPGTESVALTFTVPMSN